MQSKKRSPDNDMGQFERKLNKKIFFINGVSFLFLLIFLVLFVSLMLRKIPSPYSKVESIHWVYKSVFGLSERNTTQIESIPTEYSINPQIDSDYTLTFVGDFLPLNKNRIIFSSKLKAYLKESDFLIGNFEGIITEKERIDSIWNFDMRYDRSILNLFRKIISPSKIALSVANNHSFDFGREALKTSNKRLKFAGIKVFGDSERPFIDLDKNIRIIGATQWLNRKGRGVISLEEASHYLDDDAFNIFFPHIGYEYELYPRKKTVADVKQFLRKFDAVIGHQSYCPQPVTIFNVFGQEKIAAFSLGTFLGEVYERKDQYGLVLKLFLGRNQEGQRVLVKVEYKVIKCSQLLNKDFLVDFTPEKIGDFN